MSKPGRGLKFCPETNDLLYPREDKERRKLEFYCKTCGYTLEAEPSEACVYVSTTKQDEKAKIAQIYDVTSDPTLPRTRDCRCPQCSHNEAVFVSEPTEQGMTLYFHCISCRHKWRDYV